MFLCVSSLQIIQFCIRNYYQLINIVAITKHIEHREQKQFLAYVSKTTAVSAKVKRGKSDKWAMHDLSVMKLSGKLEIPLFGYSWKLFFLY